MYLLFANQTRFVRKVANSRTVGVFQLAGQQQCSSMDKALKKGLKNLPLGPQQSTCYNTGGLRPFLAYKTFIRPLLAVRQKPRRWRSLGYTSRYYFSDTSQDRLIQPNLWQKAAQVKYMSPTMLLSFFSSVLLENDHLKINCMEYHFEFMKTIDIGNVTPYFDMIQSSSAIVYKLRLNQNGLN